MSDLVTLHHPDLPDQQIRVDRRRVGPRLAAGWTEVSPAAEQESDEPAKSAPQRRSRKNSEEQ